MPESGKEIIIRYLEDAVAALEHLGADLRFQTEVVALQPQIAHDLGAHDLEAGLHIRDPTVEREVGQER